MVRFRLTAELQAKRISSSNMHLLHCCWGCHLSARPSDYTQFVSTHLQAADRCISGKHLLPDRQ